MVYIEIKGKSIIRICMLKVRNNQFIQMESQLFYINPFHIFYCNPAMLRTYQA